MYYLMKNYKFQTKLMMFLDFYWLKIIENCY